MIRQRHCGAVALLCMTGFGFVTDSRADYAIEVEEGVGSNEVNFDDSGLVASEAEAEGLLLVRLEGSLALGYEKFVHSGDPDARVSDVFTTIESEIAINLSPHAGLGAVLVYEPVIEPGPGEDRFFGDHGLFAEELYAGVDIGKATLQIGKIAPMFGWAADDAPGLYGGDLPGEYELVEEIGINARISLSEAPASSEGTTVEHALHAAVFTADTTFLSDSLFTSRGRLEISDGASAIPASRNPSRSPTPFKRETRTMSLPDRHSRRPCVALLPVRAIHTANGVFWRHSRTSCRSATGLRSLRSPRPHISSMRTGKRSRAGRC
jgi:hypothetical protein